MLEINDLSFIKKIDKRHIASIFAVIFVGLYSHGMGIFNKYSFHSDTSLFIIGATTTSGRWMLDILGHLENLFYTDGHFSLPIINTFALFLCIAIASLLIIDLLDIKNTLLSFFVGAIMICFPTVTSLVGFNFTAHFYGFALLLSVLGGYLICKEKRILYKTIGAFLICFATGVYQSYIGLGVLIVYIYFIKKYFYLDEDLTKKTILKDLFSALLFLLLSLFLYIFISRIYSSIFNQELSDYRGINTLGVTSLHGYITRLYNSFKEFYWPTLSVEYNMYVIPKILHIITLIIVYLALIKKIIKKIKCNLFVAFLCTLMLFFLPLSIDLVFLMVDIKDIYSLMLYSQCMIYILLIMVLDNISVHDYLVKKIVTIFVTVFLTTISLQYCRFDNKCYLKAEMNQSEAISYFGTLISRIKAIDGYDVSMPVVYINEFNKSDNSIKQLSDLSDIKVKPFDDINDVLNSFAWRRFMRIWCGYNPTVIDCTELLNELDVVEMSHYPNDNSIKIIDGVIVIKF